MISLALLVSLVATTQPAVDVWATHALDNVFADTPLPAAPGIVELSAARGQTADAQVVVRAHGESHVRGVKLSSLKREAVGEIVPESFSWHFIEYQLVKKNSSQTPASELLRAAPAEFPDAFSDAREMTIKPDHNQPIWLQLKVPASTAAGVYTGTLSIDVDGVPAQLPVKLTVYDFVLPEPRLLLTLWINDGALAEYLKVKPNTEAFWKMVDRTATMMREHHQNVVYTPWQMIEAHRGEDGKIALDFGKFDRWVQTFLDSGFRLIEISHLGGREHGGWEDKEMVSYPMPCKDVRGATTKPLQLEDWLPELQAHLQGKGWEKKTLLHVADEPTAVNFTSWRKLSQRVHRLAPQLRRIDAILTPDVAGELEVMVPLLSYLEMFNPQFQAAQKSGAELWFYTAWVPQGRYPNRLMDYPLLKTRILHWMNYTTGATGYLHWALNQWNVPFDTFAPGDNWIVWAGTDGPRSSIRYEAERAGVEDHEYLCLLEEGAQRAATRLGLKDFDARNWTKAFIAGAVPNFQDYTRDPRLLLETRDRVARAIEAFNADKPPLTLLLPLSPAPGARPVPRQPIPATKPAEPRYK